MYEEKTERKVPVYYEKDEEDFQLWTVSVKTALRIRELIGAITRKGAKTKTNKKPLALIVPAVEENPVRAVEEFETAKEVWEKLQERYAGKSVIKKLGISNKLFNMTYDREARVGDHVAV